MVSKVTCKRVENKQNCSIKLDLEGLAKALQTLRVRGQKVLQAQALSSTFEQKVEVYQSLYPVNTPGHFTGIYKSETFLIIFGVTMGEPKIDFHHASISMFGIPRFAGANSLWTS